MSPSCCMSFDRLPSARGLIGEPDARVAPLSCVRCLNSSIQWCQSNRRHSSLNESTAARLGAGVAAIALALEIESDRDIVVDARLAVSVAITAACSKHS